MKTNAIVRIVIYAVVILLLVGLLAAGLGIGTYMIRLNLGTGEYITGSGSVSAADVTDLSIEWASGSITILPADTDSITFSEEGSGEEMVYELKNGKLTISYSEPSVQIGFVSIPKKDLTVAVPKNWNCETLDIDSASTEVRIENLTVEEVELDSASASILFLDCVVDSLNVDGASNSIELSGTLGSLDCDGMSTTITAVLSNVPSAIDLDGMSSELDLTLPQDCGFRVTMEGLSNDFSSDFDTASTNGSYIYGNGSCRIDVDGMSSTVTIRKGQ